MTLPHTPARVEPDGSRRRPWIVAVLSAGTTALGLYSLTGPARNPLLSTGERVGLVDLIPPVVAAAVLLAAGLLGLLVAAAEFRTPARLPGWAVAAAALQAVGYLLLVSSFDLLILLGYLLALVLPLGIVVLLVLACRTYLVARYVTVLVVLAVAVWGYTTTALAPSNVASTFGHVGRALAAQSVQLGSLAWVSAGALVALLLLGHEWRSGGHGKGFESWLTRHRTAITLVAAAGPLPYFLARLSWLTPWPLFAPDSPAYSVRLWGLLLGGAACLGMVLTIGLIRPWGRVFPRWMPGLAGRRVPPMFAVIPGSVVALALVVAAVPMLTAFSSSDSRTFLASVFLFPCWIWGPALALAVWAYRVSRQADDQPAPTAGAQDRSRDLGSAHGLAHRSAG